MEDAGPADEMVRERPPEGAELVSWVDVRGESAPDGRETHIYEEDCGDAARAYIRVAGR